MTSKNFGLTAGLVFLVVGLAHITRVLYSWDLLISGWNFPLWGSAAGAIVLFFLAFEGFRSSARG